MDYTGLYITFAGMGLIAITLGVLAYLDDRNKRLAGAS